jgi:hypothetical protein
LLIVNIQRLIKIAILFHFSKKWNKIGHKKSRIFLLFFDFDSTFFALSSPFLGDIKHTKDHPQILFKMLIINTIKFKTCSIPFRFLKMEQAIWLKWVCQSELVEDLYAFTNGSTGSP